MTNQKRMVLVAATTGILSIVAWAKPAAAPTTEIITDPVPEITTPEKSGPRDLSHKEALWIAALEWCESRGDPEAVNEEDLDGTPSFGAFQFKPGTFSMFAKAYGIEGDLMDRDAQYAIVRRMLDDRSVNWRQQFPGCVRILGLPPS